MNEGFDYSRVQHERCPVCGRDASIVPAADLGPALADIGRQWSEFLTTVADHPGGRDGLRERPVIEVWSAIEYACHVRDMLSLLARRVELTLLAARPDYGWWDHEAAVVAEYYAEQEPAAVAEDITKAAFELASLLRGLTPEQRALEGTSLEQVYTVDGLGRFAIHEALHHLRDARAAVPSPT